ncbi:MAG: DUF4352 domain-containing protein [Chloroflexi bacterium]|nr:DUF4352 domain-containing protein [Chloroflexota bacterium]
MSFSKESQYRNIFAGGDFASERRGVPPLLLIGCAALVLIVCCSCAGLITGLQFSGGLEKMTKSVSLPFGQPAATPTLDKNAPVPLKKPGLMDNGLELTVINMQRPLKVEGGVKLPADQQYILITVQIVNTKKTGAALKATAAEFKVKGDGGLTYDANPKAVTIPGLLNEVSVAPDKTQEAELIYQIATDDSGLRLLWKVGTQTRTFILEK